MYTHFFLSLSLYIYIYIHMYVCMYIHIYIYIYIYIFLKTGPWESLVRRNLAIHTVSSHDIHSQTLKLRVSNPIQKYIEPCVKP